MTTSSWARHAPPPTGSDSTVVGRWQPATLAELTLARRRLNAALHDDARPTGCDEGAVQLLLLAFEELVSNALRHGGTPIEVTVTRIGECWLLEVRDTAADRPPAPATDRDPALGGLGLPLVAKICDDHGWTVEDGRKLVWASLAHGSAGHPDPEPPGAD